jgi:membrane protein DedA with SNARE-associated domain
VEDLLARLDALPPWQIALAASWLLLSATALPSLPEELVVIALGVLCDRGRIGFPEALAAVLAGLLPANLGAVLLGRLAGRGLSRIRPAARLLESEAVRSAMAALSRRGGALVFLTRFTPLVRGPVYLAVGVSGMAIGRFALVDALAASLHVPALLWAGSRLGRGAGSLPEAMGRVGWLALGLVAAALAVHLVRRGLLKAGVARETPPRLAPD